MNHKLRVGPKMLDVTIYVAAEPGCNKRAAGLFAWGSRRGREAYIYDPVNRAIKAGLIQNHGAPGRPAKLYVTEKGRQVIGGENDDRRI